MHDTKKDEKKAFLISVYLGQTTDQTAQEHVDELAELTQTFGVTVLEKETVYIRGYDGSTVIPSGRLATLVHRAKDIGANLVVFDDEIMPSQQRNLEIEFGIPVMDRTELILGVFAQRAQTKEARLQIELANVRYQAPRLKRLWSHLSRQKGTGSSGSGGGYTKGEGEKQIEIDRRILKDKIDDLKKQLEEVRANRQTLRILRLKNQIPVFAIVGYTNAGKSTLLNALTSAGVFVEDKLFATLDTTTRKFTLKNNQEILLVDTVGFIRKLPHLLVAAFKSTLEEALSADILIHLVDSSHPAAVDQAETTVEVLKELGAEDKPVITVLNKKDLLESEGPIRRLKIKYPHTVAISALTQDGFPDLEEFMIKELSKLRRKVNLRIPQSDYQVVAEIIRHGLILKQEYEENDVIIEAELPIWLANRLAPQEPKEEDFAKEPEDDFEY